VKSLVVVTLQILNQDYSSVFIHTVESRKFVNSYWDSWNNDIHLRRMPILGIGLGGDIYEICTKGWSDAVTEVVCPLNALQRDRLETTIQQWLGEQGIPKELEKVLFLLESGPWY
jgi:hypothetical protein